VDFIQFNIPQHTDSYGILAVLELPHNEARVNGYFFTGQRELLVLSWGGAPFSFNPWEGVRNRLFQFNKLFNVKLSWNKN